MRGTSGDKGQHVASAMSFILAQFQSLRWRGVIPGAATAGRSTLRQGDGIPAVNGNAQLHEAKSFLRIGGPLFTSQVSHGRVLATSLSSSIRYNRWSNHSHS